MSRTAKIWLIIAGILVVLGPVMIACSLSFGGLRFYTEEFEAPVIEELGSTFDQIAVRTDITRVRLATADEGQCRIESIGTKNITHTVQAEDGTLVVRSSDNRTWYERLFANPFVFRVPKITVYLPEETYRSLKVETHTGDVSVGGGLTFDNITVSGDTADFGCEAGVTNSLNIRLSTGNVRLTSPVTGSADITTSTGEISVEGLRSPGNIFLSSDTGDISLADTIAGKTMRIESHTGDVRLDGCDADEIFIKTSTGDVEGTLLSEKTFIAESSTGEIHVPESRTGGRCEIKTSTGDIRIGLCE